MKTRIVKSLNQFELMFQQQAEFMRLLQQKRTFPHFPLDLTKKDSQRCIKDVIGDAILEFAEAIQELKNSKAHKAKEVVKFNKEAFKEELCDVLHYLIEIAILAGIDYDEFFEAFMQKGRKNHRRIMKGY